MSALKFFINNTSPEEALVSPDFSEIIREFIRLFLVMLFLFCAIIFYYLHGGYQRAITEMVQEEVEGLKLMKYSMVRDLEVLLSDLHVLADNETLHNSVNTGSELSLDTVENRITNFAEDRKIYDQIRFIDASGREMVRIDYDEEGFEIVPKARLQEKSDRYYFKKTISLDSGEIYLSPLDLNVEHGKIEQPYVPTLRVASPVFDRAREVAGIIVLNYRASIMLDRFSTSSPRNDHVERFLVNQDGYWLKVREKEKEWGVQLGHGRSLGRENPEVWQKAQLSQRGSFETEEGVFLHDTIYPLEELGNEQKGSIKNGERWILFSHIPEGELGYIAYLKRSGLPLWVLAVFLILLTFGSYQIALARVVRRNNDATFRLLSRGLSQSPAAVVITNKDGEIIYVNSRFEQLTGYEREEVVGENPRIFKSGKTQGGVYADLWQTIMKGETWKGDFENKDRHDKPYFVSAQISPIINDRGDVEHFIGIQEDVTEKVMLQKKLEELATTDSLTGVNNRGRFFSLFKQEAKRLTRYDHPLTLLLFDLDNFKSINDSFGHQCGDQALMEFVKIASSALRESDYFGRLGGEEFGALLVETDIAGGITLAERLRKEVERHSFHYEQHEVRFTVSIGCTAWRRDDVVEGTFKRADKALYKAKRGGRNRVENS